MPEPNPKDPLPAQAAILLALSATSTIIGRRIPELRAAAVLIALLAVCELADRLNGRTRIRTGAIAAVALIQALWWIIPWPTTPLARAATLALCAAIVPWTVWRIGGGVGTRTREVSKIAAALPEVMKANSPKLKDKTTGREIAAVKVGKVTADRFGNIEATYSVRAPTFDGRTFAHLVAHDLPAPTHMVTDHDLSSTVAAGRHRLTVRAFPAFALDAPEMPTPDKWPKGRIPLGWDANSEIVWLPMLDSDAQHMLVGGTTGSGKSNFLRFLILAYRALSWDVWACDGSGGSLGMRTVCDPDHYHETDAAGFQLLAAAVAEMRRREATLTPGGMYDGPGILVVIDESGSVLASKAAAGLAKEISARGRKARMAIVLGLQSAYVDAAGGGQTLANLPTRVAFRTAGEKYNRQIVTDNQPGYLSHEIARENRGECVVRGMPHADWERMRTWEVIGLQEGGTAPPHRTPTPVRSTQDEHQVQVPGAVQGAGSPPDDDQRTAKDAIRDLLSDLPRPASWYASVAGCSRQHASRKLAELVDEGHACRSSEDGWRRNPTRQGAHE